MYIGDIVFQLVMLGTLLGVFAVFVFGTVWLTRSIKGKRE
ncbi:hypothetical protein SAMN05216169_10482 [Anoxybacillus pushchinoensis]|uniref:Uncharacterized protein n=1 Tax=Anoxybacillus pushchinoensis TaxID=150248 RepID=A0A1I0TV12_9BACL|nr:hypothetical protein SAMN05216169_10482 [Anoxybacillus pushchinoensis]